METNRKIWTLEEVAARRATGDVLVTHADWAVSYDTMPPAKEARLHLARVAASYQTIETDPRDGYVFPTTEAAELYALNRGCLVWYRDWKDQQPAAPIGTSLALIATGKRRRGRNIRKEHAS